MSVLETVQRAEAVSSPGAFLWESSTSVTEDEAVESCVGSSQPSWLTLGAVWSSLPWLLAACAVLGLLRAVLAGKALGEGEGWSSDMHHLLC